MKLSGTDLLQQIEAASPILGQYLRTYLVPAIEHLGTNIGASPSGYIDTPDAPQSVDVKVSGEMAHVSITHTSPLQKNVHYFTEISNTPSFTQPIVVHHGTSRTSHPINLPTQDDAGNPQKYYFRSFAQMPGSLPSAPTVLGGGSSPTPVTMGGGTKMTLLPSTGSGTGSNNGQDGGVGFGKTIYRPATTAKRTVNS